LDCAKATAADIKKTVDNRYLRSMKKIWAKIS